MRLCDEAAPRLNVTRQKQLGWASAVISLLSPCLVLLWPDPKSLGEGWAFIWACAVMWIIAVFASIVAGRLLSPRWYYLAMFWVSSGDHRSLVLALTLIGSWNQLRVRLREAVD
jgi:hypothetical protein